MKRPCASNLLINILIRIRTVTLSQLQKLGSGRNASRQTIPASKENRRIEKQALSAPAWAGHGHGKGGRESMAGGLPALEDRVDARDL